VEITSSTSPVVWYNGGACMMLTFAAPLIAANPPVYPLCIVDAPETKFAAFTDGCRIMTAL
jgi:hypothetical protein